MEDQRRLDLTYITERIITIFCPAGCAEDTYLQSLQHIVTMLQSKHGHNYMLINISQKQAALTQVNHKILDTGWADLLAPGLDQIFSMCTAMENWLQGDPRRILVLHCRGGRGRLGVLVASYIHFSNMSASADLSLDHFAMRRFYNDKLSALMTPSQKRYVWMVGSMLKGGLSLHPSPSFLLCIVLHGIPKLRPDGGCCLFLRVYQSLHTVCTSAVYHVDAAQTDRLYFVLQPAQLLKGDIMVVCYDKNSRSACRRLVFRLQFHTGLVVGHSLTFSKPELDCASQDLHFPEDGKVELLFSDSPEKIAGRELWHNGHAVMVDYDTLDPLVRRDSYKENTPVETASSHFQEPGHGHVSSKVRKKSSVEGSLFALPTGDRTPSASSDSGLSVASQGLSAARQKRGAAQDQGVRAGKLVPGPEIEIIRPLLEVMTELAARGRGEGELTGGESGPGRTPNGEAWSSERETDILEDEDVATPALEAPGSGSVGSLSSEHLPGTQTEAQLEYSTHSWVRQQQRQDLLAPERPPARGLSSRDAVQRALGLQGHVPDGTQASSCQDEEMAALNTDIDESIEQLNQLILDLDPTFVPVPTRCAPLSRSASLHSNGLSHKGNAHLSGWQQQQQQQQQLSDVTDYAALHSPGWRGGSQLNTHGHLYKSSSLDFQGQTDTSDAVPSTPAFPVSPPTPYVKHFSEFSQLRTSRQWDQHSWTQDSRSFLDAMNPAGGSADGELFGSDGSVSPGSCQRIFGSVRSVSSGGPLLDADGSTPPPVWQERTPSCPPLSLSTPNAHSSPRGPPEGRGPTDSADLSSLLLGNGSLELSLEHSLELSLLEATGGLGTGPDRGPDPGPAPLLPEKRRGGDVGERGSRSPSLSGFSSPHSGSSLSIPFFTSMTPDPLRGLGGTPSPGADFGNKQDTVKFVQDTSKFWYKPDISRDQAIAVLKDREPGSFIVRDSHSFRGAYGLAMKVATPPPSVVQHSRKVGDLSTELVRHFLIECTQKGVRLKGCPNEPYFGSLTALVCQHSITPLALPCKLILPDRDPVEEPNNSPAPTATNSAADLLKQGAACNVWYLGSVELESLTGHQAVQKATTQTLSMDPPPASTVVHFKVSAQGITLTDNQRKLFFRRHYAVNTVIFCSLDPQGRKWTRDSVSTAKIFGFVARKSQSDTENMCHLFAEHDPEQPASAIVNFVSKVMIGSHKK